MRNLTVLIAEDDDDLRKLYSQYLRLSGIGVRVACNGEEALEELRRQKPDLLLTDIAMPGMDGLELVRRVRREDEFADLRVVVMSAYGEERLTWAWGLGADEVIAKPIDMEDLFDVILRILPDKQTH